MAVVSLGKTTIVSGVVGKGGGMFAGGYDISGRTPVRVGGGSGTTQQIPTYDIITKTYTDASGNKMSMTPQNVPIGTKFTFGATRTSSGGYSYIDPKTGKGYEVSPTGVKTEIIPVTTQETQLTQPKTLQEQSQQPISLKQRVTEFAKRQIQRQGIGAPPSIDIITPRQSAYYLTKTKSPQERMAERLDKEKLKKVPVIKTLTRFEEIIAERKRKEKETELKIEKLKEIKTKIQTAKTYEEQQKALSEFKQRGGVYQIKEKEITLGYPEIIKAKGTIKTIGTGVLIDFRESTKAFSEAVTGKIEKEVKKLPVETREKIAEAPKKAVGFVYEKGIKPAVELAKKYPSPQEIISKKAGKFFRETPSPLEFKPVKKIIPITIGKPFIPIETQYQKEVEAGREKGRFRFFTEKLGKGYEQAFTGLGETYFRAKRGEIVSPFVTTKKEYKPLTEAMITGKAAGLIGESQVYAVPVVGQAAVIAPFAEAEARGELKQYVSKHPYETLLSAGYLAFSLFRVGKLISKTKVTKTTPKTTNKLLGLTDEFKTRTISFNEKISIREKALVSGQFADDVNVQSFLKTASIGKVERVTQAGKVTTRYILKGKIAGKEYVLTFGERAGKITSTRLAVTDNKIVKVYRPASPSEIAKPTKIPIKEAPPLEVARIEQLKQTGVYAKTGKINGYVEKPVGEKVLRLTKAEAKIFQVGKGQVKTKSVTEIFGLEKQPTFYKAIKPKQIAKAKAVKLEIFKQPTGKIVGEDLIISQKSMAYEKGISKLTPSTFEFDITKTIKKIGKKPYAYMETPKVPVEIKKALTKVETSQSIIKPTTKIKEVDFTSILSPQELGFELRKVITPSPKPITLVTSKFGGMAPSGKIGVFGVTGRITDLETAESGRLGVIDLKPKEKEIKPIEWDFDKLQDNIERNEKRLRDLSLVKPKPREKERGKIKPITDVIIKPVVVTRIGIDTIQRNLQNVGVIQKLTQRQKLLQKQVLKQIQVLEQPIIDFQEYRLRTPTIIKPILFKGKTEKIIPRKRLLKIQKKAPKLRSVYTASLAAAAFQAEPFKVTRKEFERLSKRKYYGIETRPILEIIPEEESKKKIKQVQF
ncbi:MAG TPA: hypothetical protein VMZ91_14710 [Candidatus Paceibacterota bacterium]|nr:hypothetical protein [Candidatus Paceibacterota bacterium]